MIKLLKNVVGATALVGTRLRQAYWKRASQRKPANAATPSATLPFEGSAEYWESRYAKGGHSGAGSYGPLAEFKSEFLNRFVAENEVQSVLEFGHGDGSQLELVNYRNYLGFDVSETAVNSCRQRFVGDKTKSFRLLSEYNGETSELALSLDVIYHLVEDQVFDFYMRRLFAAAARYVVIYSSNKDDNPPSDAPHVRHRKFTDWAAGNAGDWALVAHIPNQHPFRGDYRQGSFADFFVYEKK